MQGHPEAGRLWEKHNDAILRECGLKPTTHEPCLYLGVIDGKRVLFKRQVDNFAVAAPLKRIADILFDMIDDRLTFPLKHMGIIKLFNGMDISKHRTTSKSIARLTWSASCRNTWTTGCGHMTCPTDQPRRLPSKDSWIRSFQLLETAIPKFRRTWQRR